MLKVKDLFARKNDVDSHVDYLKGIVDALVLVQDDLESLKSLGDVGKINRKMLKFIKNLFTFDSI